MKALDFIFDAASPIVERISPSALQTTQTARLRISLWRQYRAFHAEIKQKLFPKGQEVTVLTGPFQGMRYIDEIVWGSITPRWLGSYESELNSVVTRIIERGYGTVIDVGSAEGFYAVGLAVKIPKCRLFAFDIDFISRRQLAKMAKMNAVSERLVIGRYCSHADIEALAVAGDTLLVCDIEGHELGLLDPEKAPRLRAIDILVEIHDVKENPVIERAMFERFAKTHMIERISETGRAEWIKDNFYIITAVPEASRLKALSEGRHADHPQCWLWMTVRR